jgi:hypothetical protein
MSDPIKFVFIATADHDSFTDAATKRTIELCKRFYDARNKASSILSAPATLRFLHFNHFSNEIRAFDYAFKASKSPKPPQTIAWQKLAGFGAGDPAFQPDTFVDNPGSNLNVLHIYHSVRGAPEKSVIEIAIFAHGWEEGPILRATSLGNDDNPPPPINSLPIRNASDTDGRARTDFEDNMGEDPTVGEPANTFPRTGGKDAFQEFVTALDENGEMLIFGCNGQDGVRNSATNERVATLKSTAIEVINQAYILPIRDSEDKAAKKTPRGKKGMIIASGKIPDPFTITIDMGAEFKEEERDRLAGAHYSPLTDTKRRDLHYGLDTKFFPAAGDPTTKFDRDWKAVLGLIARRMQPVYGFKAAAKITLTRPNFRVLAGPCGLKSSLVKDKQMRVCGESNKSQCARALGFHEHFMQITRGERNYSVFDSTAVARITELAKH